MILRIRLKQGRRFQRKDGKNRNVAFAFASITTPLALMAYVLGLWRLASDLGFAGESGITGVFSHWQIWLPAGAALQLAGYSLNRYGRGGELKPPDIVIFPGNPALEKSEKHDRKASGQ